MTPIDSLPARGSSVAALLLALSSCAGSGVDLDLDGRPRRDAGPEDGGAQVVVDAGVRDGGAEVDAGVMIDERTRYTWVQKNIFTQVCAAYCHRGASAPKGLQLDANLAYQRTVGRPSVEVPELLLIKPGEPTNSYLYLKVISSDPRRVGERMPLDEPPYLPPEKIEALRAWIARGAPRD